MHHFLIAIRDRQSFLHVLLPVLTVDLWFLHQFRLCPNAVSEAFMGEQNHVVRVGLNCFLFVPVVVEGVIFDFDVLGDWEDSFQILDAECWGLWFRLEGLLKIFEMPFENVRFRDISASGGSQVAGVCQIHPQFFRRLFFSLFALSLPLFLFFFPLRFWFECLLVSEDIWTSLEA